MTDLEQVARATLEQFNTGDFDAFRALVTPDFVYEEAATGRRIEGPDDVILALRAWKSALPDAAGTIEHLVIDGGTVAMEILWRGTHTGTLATPSGDIPATGRPIQVWATIWQEWQDGRLIWERHHLDVLTMLAQIGAIPAPV